MRRAFALEVLGGFVLAVAARAQMIQFDTGTGASPHGHQEVTLLTDAVTVGAGKPQDVELRFRVEPGAHINSHTPKDQLLLPTTLTVPGGNVRVLHESFPAGEAYRLAIGAGETLSVYQNEFTVDLRILAPKGQSSLRGVLRYQACGTASCYPPRKLPVEIAVTGD